MTINRFNKKHSGQVLLIITMLIATVLTVALSVSFKSTTEIQLTKLEEENQKALAAAQTGLEAALNRGTNINNIGDLSTDFTGFSGSAILETNTSNEFISTLINKNEQYTFYLANFDSQTRSFPSSAQSTYQNINICFNQPGNTSAIEVSLIKSNYSIKRYTYNPNSNNIVSNATNALVPTSGNCPTGETFSDVVTINADDISTNSLLLIVRLIGGSSSKIGFKANSNFPLQGNYVVSTAKSPGGAEKKIRLFQSYPQIPADFFVTSF